MSDDRFQTVAWVYDAGELALLCSLFEWEGIPVAPLSYGQCTTQWTWMTAFGGVQMRVRTGDVSRALGLLGSLERSPQTSVRFFARDKMVDVLLMLLLFVTATLAPPARIQAEFAFARPERARSEA